MDGLLFDSERIVQRSWEIAGNELGIQYMGEVIYHTLGMNRTGRNEYFRKYIREDFPFEEFGELTRDNFWKIVDKEGLPLKSGAKELLAYGKAQGYKMAVATSSSREYAMRNLIRTGIDAYFDSVICGDMVKKAKPDPEIYQKASESLGIQPEYRVTLHRQGVLHIAHSVSAVDRFFSIVYDKHVCSGGVAVLHCLLKYRHYFVLHIKHLFRKIFLCYYSVLCNIRQVGGGNIPGGSTLDSRFQL